MGVYTSVVVVACQLLAPLLLCVSILFTFKLRGMESLSAVPFCVPVQVPPPVTTTGIKLFSEAFYRGFYSFLTWWIMALWSVFSAASYYYEKGNNVLAAGFKTQ